jgi:hypothetical protein
MSFGLDGPRLVGDSRGMDTALNMRVSTNGQKLDSQDVELKRYCRRRVQSCRGWFVAFRKGELIDKDGLGDFACQFVAPVY